MSFNVLCYGCEGHSWLDRDADVIATVRNYMPDIFGIQEAHIGWMGIFRESMDEYDFVGVGRDDGKDEGEFSPVFYKKDKFTLVDKGWFWISETPDVPSRSWNSACTRIASWAKLTENESGKTFVAMNTHLDHRSEEARKNGVRLINEFAAKLVSEETENYPTFHPYFHHNEPEDVIDFIFISDGFNAKSYRVIKDKPNGAFPSDHCPIMSEISIK